MTYTREELTRLIDLAHDAVDRSKVGPFVLGQLEPQSGGPPDCRIVSRLAMDTFLCLLASLAPKHLTNEMTVTHKTEGEDWKPE